eukprot:365663-Chlamydomonas_euryale.AAC.25
MGRGGCQHRLQLERLEEKVVNGWRRERGSVIWAGGALGRGVIKGSGPLCGCMPAGENSSATCGCICFVETAKEQREVFREAKKDMQANGTTRIQQALLERDNKLDTADMRPGQQMQSGALAHSLGGMLTCNPPADPNCLHG